MGKGWAKGLTKATDPRVAGMAAAHTGMRYVRRTPPELCKWPHASRTTLPLEWSAEMAYLVGLTATDGCLGSRKRSITFKSADRVLVEIYRDLLGRTNKIGEERTRAGNTVYRLQFGDAALYDWLRGIGLMPRKSLVLGAIAVPPRFLRDLTRGLLDGDGSILNYAYDGTGKAHGTYEALRTVFVSASWMHLSWLEGALRTALGIRGSIGTHLPNGRRNPIFRLAYANRESERLLRWMYASLDIPCLPRKREVWDRYRLRHECASTLPSSSVR